MTNAPKKRAGIKDALMRLGPALALILMFIVFAVVMPGKFLRVANLMNVLKQASINCMIGAGMLLCLITAGIDLSVGYNCTLACCIIGVLLNMGVTRPFLLIPAALLVSTLAGFVNGTLLTRLDLPHPFVSTLGAKIEVYNVMNQLVKAGNCVIMVSSEMPEILAMIDRVLVMRGGRVMAMVDRDSAHFNQEDIMKAAWGGSIE